MRVNDMKYTRSAGKENSQRSVGPGQKILAAVMAATLTLSATPVWPEVAPANGNTTVFNHPSGVPVVNIAKPNSSGLSHNQYDVFNVPMQGTVLNNATSVTMTQLAGTVPINTNLGGQAAKIILNEVVSANRSQLNGFLEVAGQQADVIIANPYGITCTGCGFINTPRVTLSTGAPTFASDGSLSGFLVNAGDVLINGNGLNAKNQNILDVVARSVLLDAQLNGNDVQLIAGQNNVDYNARTATPAVAATGAAPSYSIDSTALGGLYANRIRLIATENNVGVRMLGEMAATADDLVLTSSGKIELRNKASAARDVVVTYTGTNPGDAAAITLGGNANSLSAGRNLTVSGGGLTLEGGKLGADAALLLNVDSLTETAAGQRFAGTTLNVDAGVVALNGGSWDAGTALAFMTDSLSVGANGAGFYASRNGSGTLSLTTVSADLDLAAATLKNNGNINLASAAGLDLAINGNVQSGSNINLSAASVLQNSGKLLAEQNITLRSSNAVGTLAATLGGEVRAGNFIDVAGYGSTPNKAVDLTVTGTTVAQQLQIKAEDLVVNGLLQGTAGTILQSDTLLVAGSNAKLVASDTASGVAVLNVGVLTNEGVVQAKNDIALNIGNQLENKTGSALLAGGNITLRSTNPAGNIALVNAGTLQAGSPASGTTLVAGTALDIAGYDNGAGPNSNITFNNSGNVFADILALNISSLSNSALIAASSQSDINVQGTLLNSASGRILLTQATANAGTIHFDILQNAGALESAGGMSLFAGSTVNNNAGKILADGALTIRASGTNTVTLQNNGVVQSAGTLDIGGHESSPGVLARNINLDNAGGTFTGKQFVLKAGSVSNTGTLQAGSVVNGSYSKVAGDNLVVDVLSIINQVSGAKILGYDTTLTADTISNQGVIHAGNTLDVSAARIDNGRTGGISGLGQATLRANRNVAGVSNELNNFGLILSGGALELTSSNVIRNYADASNTGDIYATGNMTIAASQLMANQGTVESKQGNIHITAPTVENSIADPGKYWVTDSDVLTYQGDSGRYTGETHHARSGQTAQTNYPGAYFRPSQGFDGRLFVDFSDTVNRHEVFNAPLSALRPQIIAGSGSITIDGFQTLNNTGGLLSAGNNITLSGVSFINETLALYNESYTNTGRKVFSCDYFYATDAACADTGVAAPERHYLTTFNDPAATPTRTLRSEIGAGVRAGGTLFINGVVSVKNAGALVGVGDKGSPQQGSTSSGTVGSGGAVNLGGGASVGLGLDLSLPSSPNGFFVPSKDPSSGYLIETNPLFGFDAAYLGSEYLAVKLGIPTDTLQLRLGDAAYENYLIRQQVIAQTGFNLIPTYRREADQTESLLDNAVRAAGELHLVFGVALTEEQVNALTTDIVWAVEQVVAGKKVLVPVVYLSRATRDGITHGAVIAATNINMDVGSLSNTGGTIAATGTMTVIAKNDIRNTSGTLSAGTMALVSTDGKVINETTTYRAGDKDNYQDIANKTGSITANNLVISGKEGVDIIGATVSAGESAVIHSESGDINITSLALESKSTELKRENGFLFSSSEKTVQTDQSRLAASVTVGDGKNSAAQLTLLAEKGNVNLTSADLASSGGVNIKANDINSTALNLEHSKTFSSESSGISSSGGALTIGSSSAHSEVKSSTASGSSIVAGGALNMMAANDIVLEGGSYAAKTVSLAAGNDVITKAANNTYSFSESSASAGLTMGNGSIGAGAKADATDINATRHDNAQIVAADGVSVDAKHTVDIGGVDVAVLNKVPAQSSAQAGGAENAAQSGVAVSDVSPAVKAAPVIPGFDVNALRKAVAGGDAAQLIADTSNKGMGVADAMVDMKQAEVGQLSISGESIISTKYKDEYRKRTESSGTYVGVGTQSDSSSGGIGLSISNSQRKESTSEKSDNINNLSADNIALEGSKSIDLKGVAIAGGSSVGLKSEGDITISAAEVEQQHTLEGHSTHLDVGVSASVGVDKGPLNVTGPVEVAATLGFGVETQSLDARSKGHVDSVLSSGGVLSIESGKGNVTWTGVTAVADALNIKAENFNSAAYQDSHSIVEANNSLGVNLSMGTDIGKSVSSLFSGNGSKSTTLQSTGTDEVGNTIIARSVDLDIKDNVTLVGGNLVADDVRIKANTVDIKAEKSTLDEHKTEVGVSLVMDGSAAFGGSKAWASIDSMKEKPESGVTQNDGHADRTGDGRVNNGKAVSDELLSGRTGLSITSKDETSSSESYRNATLQFNSLAIDTTSASAGKGDGHVDIGGASLLGKGDASSINIATGELKTTKYVDRSEVTSHDNSTFIGVAVEGHSAIADTMNHEKTLEDKKAQGMTLDDGWVAAQRAGDATNMAMGDAVGGSVAATVRNIDTQTHSVSTSENITYLNASNINIKTTQGDIALNGVEFNAPPVYNKTTGTMEKATGPRAKNISLDSAKDISLTAAKSTYAETSTTLTNDFNVTAAGSVSGSGSGVGVDVGYNGSIDQSSLAKTTYSNASLSADNVSIKSKNLSLTGANISGANVSIDVEKNISVTSVQDTQTQQTSRGNWGGSVGLNTTSVVSVNGQGGGGDSHDNYAKTAAQSGISAEKNLDVAAGGNLTMTGAYLASAGTGSVNVKGDLTVNKLNDFHETDGLFAGASTGINQGGLNAGINLEKVDQVHNATTQNSTISGLAVTVGGKTQGDNLQADGSLQTQATTVLKDEKIAGVYVNGTGVVTRSGVKGAVAVLGSAASKVMPGKTPAVLPVLAVNSENNVVPVAGKHYDSAVVIMKPGKNGLIDPAVQKSADTIKAAHPDTVFVTATKDGTGVEGGIESLAGVRGNARVDMLGHGEDMRADGAVKLADLFTQVADRIEQNPGAKVSRAELTTCGNGVCSLPKSKTLGQEVTEKMARPGVRVVEHDSAIQIENGGKRVAAKGQEAKTISSTFTKEKGVESQTRLKADTELVAALDPSRKLGKEDGEDSDGSDTEAGKVTKAPRVEPEAPFTLPDGFSVAMGPHTVTLAKDDSRGTLVVDANGIFSTQQARKPVDAGKDPGDVGTALANKFSAMKPEDLRQAEERLAVLTAAIEKQGSAAGVLVSTHKEEVEKFMKESSTLAYDKPQKAKWRDIQDGADEAVATSITLQMLPAFNTLTGDQKKMADTVVRFLSAIRQPTKNVQATIDEKDVRVGVVHPTSKETHPDHPPKGGNSSEHIYADEVRGQLFLDTVDSLLNDDVPADQAIMLGAVKAMQFTLSDMSFAYEASNVSTKSNKKTRTDFSPTHKAAQTQEREVMKHQIDEILALFGVAKHEGEQGVNEAHAYKPDRAGRAGKTLERTHSDFRVPAKPPAPLAPPPAPSSVITTPVVLPDTSSSYGVGEYWRYAA